MMPPELLDQLPACSSKPEDPTSEDWPFKQLKKNALTKCILAIEPTNLFFWLGKGGANRGKRNSPHCCRKDVFTKISYQNIGSSCFRASLDRSAFSIANFKGVGMSHGETGTYPPPDLFS